jgi:dihydrofolate reductase
MTAVSWHVVMALDGFIAAPGDDMRWVFEVAGPSDTVDQIVTNTGAIVMGRRTYEVEDRDRRGIYGGAWNGPLFVLTHKAPPKVPDWMTGTFVHDGIEDAVARAKAAAGDRIVGILGANIAHQCLDAGLLDEIVVQVASVLLGGGSASSTVPKAGRSSSTRRAWPSPGNSPISASESSSDRTAVVRG